MEIFDYKKLEKTIKGFANLRRIKIIELLKKEPNLSVEEIAEKLHIGYMNASDHIRKLDIADLVLKKRDRNNVRHKVTERAVTFLEFCKKLK